MGCLRLRVFHILAAASLLLCLATFATPHGGMAARLLIVNRPDLFEVTFLSYGTYAISSSRGGPALLAGGYRLQRADQRRFLGFEVWKGTKGGQKAWYVWLPVYPLTLLSAVLPVVWTIRFARAQSCIRRAHSGLCPACGYDLRATPDRCPECGRTSHAPASTWSAGPPSP